MMQRDLKPRVLADFEGKWDLTRQITHDDGSQARFEGTALWTPDGLGMAYLETGLLEMAHATPMQAERRYHWGPDLDIYFEDGRFFHRVPAAGGDARHWCDPDTYDVTYDFTKWPRFKVIWRVVGPKKSYTLASLYHRC
ncbi:hypothetical protein ROLI_027830 [Roseobacter fucihabitans]|uniref:DUF6314 domain-containing protein n=1 Tax=Roseobacter fucihabitans TaxID=1537242 RepID=A0ABZ2BWD8_9RHOB|nr:DUF6314 family protein [Roseobacter litoralis]MBC6967083.1 hypothetical protein [Roseobacter litoralis]